MKWIVEYKDGKKWCIEAATMTSPVAYTYSSSGYETRSGYIFNKVVTKTTTRQQVDKKGVIIKQEEFVQTYTEIVAHVDVTNVIRVYQEEAV